MSSLLAQLDELSDAGSEASEAEAPPEGFSYVTGLRATAADVLGPLLSREELRSRLEERSAARQRRDFRAADAALYRAKAHGKNCVVQATRGDGEETLPGRA